MGTYDRKQLLSDYVNDRMDVERAMGHSLQHIDNLYEGQTAASTDRRELRTEINRLKDEVKTLRAEVDRLAALIEKPPDKPKPKRQGRSPRKQQKEQP